MLKCNELPIMVKLGWFSTCALTVLSVTVSALPTAPIVNNNGNASFGAGIDTSDFHRLGKRDAPDWYFRILPLGASIVWGEGSSNGNG